MKQREELKVIMDLTGIAVDVVQATIGQIPGIDDIIDEIVGEDTPPPNVAPMIILSMNMLLELTT